jgi:hypothetical protein
LLEQSRDKSGSTSRGQTGISMNVHALGLSGCWFAQPQLLNSRSHEQPLETSHLEQPSYGRDMVTPDRRS